MESKDIRILKKEAKSVGRVEILELHLKIEGSSSVKTKNRKLNGDNVMQTVANNVILTAADVILQLRLTAQELRSLFFSEESLFTSC